VPQKYLRREAEPGDLFRHVVDFFRANAATIHAQRVMTALARAAQSHPHRGILFRLG
jgi:hypothetical protein